MNKKNLSPAERIAALEEQNARLSDRTALAQQMQVCAENRDALADRLNRVIAVAEWRRAKQRRAESAFVGAMTELYIAKSIIAKTGNNER